MSESPLSRLPPAKLIELHSLLVSLQEAWFDSSAPGTPGAEELAWWISENIPGRERMVCSDCGSAGFGFHACPGRPGEHAW